MVSLHHLLNKNPKFSRILIQCLTHPHLIISPIKKHEPVVELVCIIKYYRSAFWETSALARHCQNVSRPRVHRSSVRRPKVAIF